MSSSRTIEVELDDAYVTSGRGKLQDKDVVNNDRDSYLCNIALEEARFSRCLLRFKGFTPSDELVLTSLQLDVTPYTEPQVGSFDLGTVSAMLGKRELSEGAQQLMSTLQQRQNAPGNGLDPGIMEMLTAGAGMQAFLPLLRKKHSTSQPNLTSTNNTPAASSATSSTVSADSGAIQAPSRSAVSTSKEVVEPVSCETQVQAQQQEALSAESTALLSSIQGIIQTEMAQLRNYVDTKFDALEAKFSVLMELGDSLKGFT